MTAAPTQKALVKKVGSLVVALIILAGLGIFLFVSLDRSAADGVRAVASALVADLQKGESLHVCTLYPPTTQSSCRHAVTQLLSTGNTSYRGIALGQVTVNGDRAVFMVTGSTCYPIPTDCRSNHDPDFMAGSGESFDRVYKKATGPDPPTGLTPLVEQQGRWYLTGR